LVSIGLLYGLKAEQIASHEFELRPCRRRHVAKCGCHAPRKRGIQYASNLHRQAEALLEYWIIRFRG
jgi:hypothetical protein